MEKQHNNNISRRKFLGILGASAGAIAIGAGCDSDKNAAAGKRQRGQMTYRVNPNTGDRVSILGYGCMRLPTVGMSADYYDRNGEIDQEAVNESVDQAMAAGINYYDTSPAYCKGQSEHAMGIALSRYPRDKYYIATKLSNFDPSTWSREASIAMFQNSLKELQTDYVDYLLLHGIGMGGMEAYNGRYEDNGMLDYLIEQRKNGTIRNLGFSYHGDNKVFYHLLDLHDQGRVKWDFAQIQLNYVDWFHATEINERNTDAHILYDALQSRGIPSVIMEPLLGGRLAQQLAFVEEKMRQRRPDDSVAAWAFRYAGTPEGVLTVLSGMTYLEHLNDNIDTYSPLEPLTDDERHFLEDEVANAMLANELVPCTACNYCMPCPYGLNIPAVFAHFNKCINDDNIVADTRDPRYAQARRAYLVGLDRAVPRLRQATECIECGNCLSHCPQHIDIPTQMRRIDTYTENLRRTSPTVS